MEYRWEAEDHREEMEWRWKAEELTTAEEETRAI